MQAAAALMLHLRTLRSIFPQSEATNLFTLRQSFLAIALHLLTLGLGNAQSTSTITDTVQNADGSAFNGTVVITWSGATPSSGPAPYSTSAKIINGVLSVALVPTVAYNAYYLAVFNSADGRNSWVENWQVGPSSSPLNLSQIRVTLSTTPTAPSTATFAMAQVTGLNAYLNALSSSVSTVSSTIGGFNTSVAGLNNSISTLNDRVNALQTIVSSPATGTLVEGETPAGTVNGTNAGFSIVSTPISPSSLMLFRNGILQVSNVDYSLNNKNILFAVGSIPQNGDVLQASYRIGAPAQSVAYIDAETPQGTVNGTNLNFSLSTAPSSNTLRIYRNGALLFPGVDYSVNGAVLNFTSTASAPVSGDRLLAYYRITTQTP